MDGVLQGVTIALCWVAALLFLRFYKRARDRLFAVFAAAFFTLSLSWILPLVYAAPDEHAHYAFGFRLVAFLLIIYGIVDKNRAAP
jgi:hypothetical protein